MSELFSPPPVQRLILAVNAGSSSLKIAVFEANSPPVRLASAKIERIGASDAKITLAIGGEASRSEAVVASSHDDALAAIMSSLRGKINDTSIAGVGHRLVHGGPNHSASEVITPKLLDDIRQLELYDPEHLPSELQVIESLKRRLSNIPHVACFDTAFHHDLPAVARRLPLPRRFDAFGVRRYGFHGLSYAYLMDHLARLDYEESRGRIVLAHLGNGASLAAVRDGKPIDTSMAFTPAAGIPMSTRSGDIDPGLIEYLLRSASITVQEFNRIIHLESGLLGVSETSGDMELLLEHESEDARAGEAVAIFCYHVRKYIGAYAAAMGGLDTLVFTGGIGERAAKVRLQICAELRFLGIELDPMANSDNSKLISNGAFPVKVRVITTDEEQMIAKDVINMIGERH
ncbi:acetate/propionate family kinase [Lacipirellula parvula]|uniref:Acetate kinase n=1 Tax=Lacipirellula parvula TaxID=2650471 RepID=A0A5K7XKH5_9BACT|nr:acetate/propionate family kinase [Lacipirellula parvula]BBO33439.1 acetate kinase [Lacipirellula parvula]